MGGFGGLLLALAVASPGDHSSQEAGEFDEHKLARAGMRVMYSVASYNGNEVLEVSLLHPPWS